MSSGRAMPRRPYVAPKPRATPTVAAKDKVQDPVDVFCRVKPADFNSETCVTVVNDNTINLSAPYNVGRSGLICDQVYRFKEVFSSVSSQKEVFDKVAKPLVSDLLSGQNGLLFAYGVTGSGKTHTMQGSSKDGGIIRRTLDVLFNSIHSLQADRNVFRPDHLNGFEVQVREEANRQSRVNGSRKLRNRDLSHNSSDRVKDESLIEGMDEDNCYSVFVTFIESYNKYVYDLLEDVAENNMTKSLQTKVLREDANHNMYVHGCNEVEVKSPEEALDMLYRGQKRRKVAHTKLNAESSRSHSIFTIRVVQCPLDAQGAEVFAEAGLQVSQLSLVDLAGSERTSRSGAQGLRVKEAGSINNVLMTLRTCIEVLRENQVTNTNRLVPYRDSKVTHYFKNYFDGKGKVKMIICLNPLTTEYEETLPVMKFAELASEVQVQRSVARTPMQGLGLNAGRRRANELFRQVRRNMAEENAEKARKMEMNTILAPGCNAWPALDFSSDSSMLATLDKVANFYTARISTRKEQLEAVKGKISAVVSTATEREEQNLFLQTQNASLDSLYKNEANKLREMERKFRDAETRAQRSESRNIEVAQKYDNLVDEYNQVVEESDMVKNQGQIDKQRYKAKLYKKLEQETKKKNDEYQKQIKNVKQELVRKQINALKEFEGNSTAAGGSAGPSTPLHSKPPVPLPSTAPVSNSRYRSSFAKTQVNVVIDHRPLKTIDLNTVYQPQLGRRRSVTKLKTSDLGKGSHYVLTTQDNDSQGDLTTKLYKGDVLPTTGGGNQVVFKDVEILKQKDPLNFESKGKKRSSDTAATFLDSKTSAPGKRSKN